MVYAWFLLILSSLQIFYFFKMKAFIQNTILISCLISCLAACNKTDTNTTDTDPVPLIGGLTSAYKDTVSVVVNGLSIKYSKTSACFPSNEIFAFDVTANNLPTAAIYQWNFGDGHVLKGKNVRNIYETAGTYTVTVTVLNSNNQLLARSTISVEAKGQQVTPHAAFSSQIYDVNFVNNMAFTSSSSVQRGTLTNYTWNWGDGNTTSTSNAVTLYNFTATGQSTVYPVQLIVTANSGCKDTATIPVTVAPVYNISGDFSAVSSNVCDNETFVFTPTATGVPAGAVYRWDFADATGLVTGNPVIKRFTYQNDYDVKMTILLNGKTIYQTHKWVKAYGQNIKPKALFLKNVVISDATTVTWAFYSQSNIPHGYFIGYKWDINNGARIDDNFNTYIEHKFNKAATNTTQNISFIVTGNSGCTDTARTTIVIPAL